MRRAISASVSRNIARAGRVSFGFFLGRAIARFRDCSVAERTLPGIRSTEKGFPLVLASMVIGAITQLLSPFTHLASPMH
jgi:hypothetical protein